MDVEVNADGSTVVTCDGHSVKVRPRRSGSNQNIDAAADADDSADPDVRGPPTVLPGTIVSIVSRTELGVVADLLQGSLRERTGFRGQEVEARGTIVVNLMERINISHLIKALEEAGYGGYEIEVIPPNSNG